MTYFDAMKLERGDCIIYVPLHAEGNVNHPDCEHGFVECVTLSTVYCRLYGKTGKLRTICNSEGCDPINLVRVPTLRNFEDK